MAVIEGPTATVPGKAALWLEKRLGLNELRIKMRGQNAELDKALSDLHSAAMLWVAHEQFRDGGTVIDPARNSSDNWDTGEVAGRAGCTTRAVRKAAAANPPQLIGTKDEADRWQFDQSDALLWMATRNKENK